MSGQSRPELDTALQSEAAGASFEYETLPVQLGAKGFPCASTPASDARAMTEHGELHGVLGALFDSVDDHAFSVDASFRYTSFNAAHAAGMKVLYGADIELGRSILDYQTVPEDRRNAQANIGRALGGERVVAEAYAGDEALARRRLEITHAPIRDDGRITGVVVRSRDVTDRHLAEQADARLAAIVESTDDAILSKTLDGTIVTWNRGAEQLYGYAAEEIVGKSVAMLMPSDSNGELASLLGHIRGGGSVEHYETIRVRKDGSSVEVALSVSPIHDHSGVVIGASTIARDITDRKQVERALRESAAMLNTAEGVARLGSWRWDLSTGRVTWSRGMLRLFAVDPAGFDGDWTKVLPERVHPDDLAAVRKAIASVQESGVPVPGRVSSPAPRRQRARRTRGGQGGTQCGRPGGRGLRLLPGRHGASER